MGKRTGKLEIVVMEKVGTGKVEIGDSMCFLWGTYLSSLFFPQLEVWAKTRKLAVINQILTIGDD